jgi:general secretion pathway protein G
MSQHGKNAARRVLAGGRRGFTLVELLLVLVILATLAAIVIPKFAGRSEQAKETAAKTQISSIGTALDSFEVDMGYYPKTGDGLNVLMDEPRNAKGWRGPYLKNAVTADPWGNAYIYEYPGRHNDKSYDLISLGPDGQRDTSDDITNWNLSEK